MRGRTVAIVLAGAGLLVLLVVLKQSIGSAADTPSRDREPAESSDEPVKSGEPVGTASSGNRDARIPAPSGLPSAAGKPASASSEPSGSPAPSLDPAATPERKTKRPPVANKTVLREQVDAVANLVADCVTRATGKKDGTAYLNFVVAPRGTEAVVESTGVEEDGTSIENDKLLECMHQTALQMKFTAAADSDAVYARREIVVENGAVTVNRLVDFSYLRK